MTTDNSTFPAWIDVREELPEVGVDVLICTKKGQVRISTWSGHKPDDNPEYMHYYWKWQGNFCPYVLYWMPLPTAPDSVISKLKIK